MKQKLTENQTSWLADLRSGDYEQGMGQLHCKNKFCCLGVAAKKFATAETVIVGDSNGHTYDGENVNAPQYVVAALNLYGDVGNTSPEFDGECLETLNDDGATFTEIADLIEKDPSRFFRAGT